MNESLQIIGALWYLLAVERNDTCWQKACKESNRSAETECITSFLYCGNQGLPGYDAWNRTNHPIFNGTCSGDDGVDQFDFGIYTNALTSGIVSSNKLLSKYCYCLWWGLQNLR